MGWHSWIEQCPYCNFEGMLVSSNGGRKFDVICPICGYATWTEEKTPSLEDVELARQTISAMSADEIEEAIESFYEFELPLVTRSKGIP